MWACFNQPFKLPFSTFYTRPVYVGLRSTWWDHLDYRLIEWAMAVSVQRCPQRSPFPRTIEQRCPVKNPILYGVHYSVRQRSMLDSCSLPELPCAIHWSKKLQSRQTILHSVLSGGLMSRLRGVSFNVQCAAVYKGNLIAVQSLRATLK